MSADPAGSAPERPRHGELVRPGARTPLRLVELPPWHGWQRRSEAAAAVRWIEKYVVVPSTGRRMRVAGFQRRIVATMYESLASFVSLPAANGKTTFLAAVALERLVRGGDYSRVDVVATKEEQAAILVEASKSIVECCPQLVELCAWHSRDAELEYRPTGSRMRAHPAKLSALQGLEFDLAIVDEVGFAEDAHVEALLARVGKRPGARVIGIGTPGFEANVLSRIRGEALDGVLPAGVRYLEWSAPAGSDVSDRRAWRTANPALGAGFLRLEALEMQAAMLPERAFRTYHLGQWISEHPQGWLPAGAWDACPHVAPAPPGAPVVLAVEGTYRRTLAVVGASLDGAVFLVWAADAATDDELRAVLARAVETWDVQAVVHSRRIRVRLFDELAADGMPLEAWAGSPDVEAASANELWREICDRRLAHDHAPLLDEHMAAMGARWMVDGSLRLTRRDDGGDCDAALAARMAWWHATRLDPHGHDAPQIY